MNGHREHPETKKSRRHERVVGMAVKKPKKIKRYFSGVKMKNDVVNKNGMCYARGGPIGQYRSGAYHK